jgi:DNA (cytosine-5)-methyltransferase 1
VTTTPDVDLDLFAGPGGWDVAAAKLGLRPVGVEFDTAACQTRAAAGHVTVRADVAAIPTARMRGHVRTLIDSAPCQPWSRAGKQLGLEDQELVHQALHDLSLGRDTRASLLTACKDKRSLLAAEPMRYLNDLRPETVVKEEVLAVLPLFRHYAEILRSWGYSVWVGELNAADYGVPQTRRRAILIASRVRAVSAPEPTHAETAEEIGLFGPSRVAWVSMAEALGLAAGHTVNTRGDRKTPGGNEFPADRPSWALTEKARSWQLKSRRDSDNWIAKHGDRPNRGADEPAPAFTGEAHRWSWVLRSGQSVAGVGRAERQLDEPSVTITGRADLCSWSASGVEAPEPVRLSIHEAAVLQSFPADYPWQGSRTKQFEQCGNAVPPLLAAHVLSAATGIPLTTTLSRAA